MNQEQRIAQWLATAEADKARVSRALYAVCVEDPSGRLPATQCHMLVMARAGHITAQALTRAMHGLGYPAMPGYGGRAFRGLRVGTAAEMASVLI